MMNHTLKPALLFVCLLLLSMTGAAQTNRWKGIGPEGGVISALVQHPLQGNILYAVVQGKPAPLFRSTDGGLRWTKCWEFESAIACLKTNPHKPNMLYAVTGSAQLGVTGGEALEPGRLYESGDQGNTWSSKPLPPIYAFTRIEFDAKAPGTIHALAHVPMTQGIVYLKSTDDGSTWMTTEVLSDRGWATNLTLDKSNPDIIYVGAYPMMMTNDSKFLYRSTNGGKSFSPVTLKTNFISPVNDVVLDSRNPGRIFFLNYGGVYRSTDDGMTWKKNKGTVATPQRLWIDPVNSERLIVIAGKGVAESNDGGVTFKEAAGKLPGGGVSSVVVASGVKTTIFVSNTAGIFRTTDLGNSWMPSHKGILGTQITSLRLSASSPGTLLAGVMTNAVYKTSAAGALAVAWDQLPVFYTCTSIGDIQVMPKKPYKVLAIEGGG